ncbi:MAG: hypothetical protein JNM65_03590 [Verrucomicrobiaceae bacterium]|nr:hypothetical protein [Verrucomicrobiaceae bacterium]
MPEGMRKRAMAGTGNGDEVVIVVRKTTTRRPVIALGVKSLFNAVHPLRGFICKDAVLVRGEVSERQGADELNALIRATGATARAWLLKESFEHF